MLVQIGMGTEHGLVADEPACCIRCGYVSKSTSSMYIKFTNTMPLGLSDDRVVISGNTNDAHTLHHTHLLLQPEAITLQSRTHEVCQFIVLAACCFAASTS